MLKRILNYATHKIHDLPIVVLMPHSRCNCRCVMCDIWKANHTKKEITVEDLRRHVDVFKKLGVREIVFSGGEALMHSNFWALCKLLSQLKIRLTLLSTGLLLEKNAKEIVEHIDNVIISLDGREEIHDRIRNVPGCFQKIRSGIQAIRNQCSDFPITGRSVVQKLNYFDFQNTARAAKSLGLDKISFLAADISSSAFNHEGLTQEKTSAIALSKDESIDFEKLMEDAIVEMKDLFEDKFIAERPEKLRRIVQYYKAINNLAEFPEVICNAPWVSAVVESNGDVMPCFFHKPYGNIYQENFKDIINSKASINFRRTLNIQKNPVCSRCVCSLKLGLTQIN